MSSHRLDPTTIVPLRRLRNEARRLGPLSEEPLDLPWTGETYHVLRPTDTDRLLDRAAADPEQNLPYWAELWPSGIALADAIAARSALIRDRRVLEVGSGLGVTAVAALRAGAALTVADYSAESLVLCRHNAVRNAGREPEALRLNWRRPDWPLLERAGPVFPVLLAADVLYEGRDVEPLLALVERLVAPDGFLWLAEPGRPVAATFLEAARAAGWRDEGEPHPGPWPDPKDVGVIVNLHRLWRG